MLVKLCVRTIWNIKWVVERPTSVGGVAVDLRDLDVPVSLHEYGHGGIHGEDDGATARFHVNVHCEIILIINTASSNFHIKIIPSRITLFCNLVKNSLWMSIYTS